jgi:uncharacterized protein
MAEFNKARPASPCINLCRMDDEDRYCLGCFRTLDEIALWSDLNTEEKELVWQALDNRRSTQT